MIKMPFHGYLKFFDNYSSSSQQLLSISIQVCTAVSTLPAHPHSPSGGSISQSSDNISIFPGISIFVYLPPIAL